MEGKTFGFLVALCVVAAFAIGVAYLGMSQFSPRSEGILGATVPPQCQTPECQPPQPVTSISQVLGFEKFSLSSNEKLASLNDKYKFVEKGQPVQTEAIVGTQTVTIVSQTYTLIPKDGSPSIESTTACVTVGCHNAACSLRACSPSGAGCHGCSCDGDDAHICSGCRCMTFSNMPSIN